MTSQIALGGEDLCDGASDEEQGHELGLRRRSFGTHKLPLNTRYLITMWSESCLASGAPSVFIAIRELCAGTYGVLIYQKWSQSDYLVRAIMTIGTLQTIDISPPDCGVVCDQQEGHTDVIEAHGDEARTDEHHVGYPIPHALEPSEGMRCTIVSHRDMQGW
ncbi:hypothetical protein B0H13DRAFT_1899364 [Mycena leptocephala]|nr:hypothetical protein B0H13DRAFT_1899364 [Mycena leptocephala]